MKSDFIIALTQLAAERNLPRGIVLSAIEDALVSAYRKDSVAAGQNISVKLDPGSGDVTLFVVKTVAEEVEDPQQEISVGDAKKINPEAELGEVVATERLPHSAGRIAAQTAKQVVIQRLREAERDLVFQEYEDKEGEVFTVTVQKMEPGHVTVEMGRAEATLPSSEQSAYERYRVGQKLRVLLQSVRRSNKGPELIVSRADQLLVKRLFETEVPEIYSGSVEIVSIAREAGSRSKVAVFAKQDGVDAVGSCVGLRGIRIQNIVNELHGEKIDVVKWNKDATEFLASALSPSTVLRVEINEESGAATAIVPERQLSLAIGKEGQNARLAAKLTGWNLDIKSDVEADASPEDDAEEAPPENEAVPSEEQEPAEEVVAEVAEAEEVVAEVAEAEEVVAEVAEAEEPAEEVVTEVAEAEEVVAEVAEAEEPAEEEEVAEIPEELLLAEEVEQPDVDPVPVVDSHAIQDLPEDIWNLRNLPQSEPGVIRFAEDIDELAKKTGPRGARRGSGSSARRGSRRRGPVRRR